MVALEILGRDRTDDSILWARLGDHEIAVTDTALAVARRTIQRGEYEPTLRGYLVDEEQITTLINALNAPQPFWPPLICRVDDCGTEAIVLDEGDPYCRRHAVISEERQ